MKNSKLCIILFLLLCVIGAGGICSQKASAKTATGSCGKNAYWTYDTKTKTLEISGKGSVTEVISIKKALNRKATWFYVKTLIIHEGITTLKDCSILKHGNSPGLYSKVSLPNSFRRIPSKMFGSIDVKKLFIPKNVSTIEEGAFWQQYRLQEITVSAQSEHYSAMNGVLFDKKCSALVYYPRQKEDVSYEVPASVVKIAPLAFAGNQNLKRITLPVNLKQLGGGAFFACTELESTNISDLHQLTKITDYHNYPLINILGYDRLNDMYSYYLNGYEYDGEEASGCPEVEYLGTFEATSIRSFIMPDSLQYVASETFRECHYLQTFYIGKNFKGRINYGGEFAPKTLSLYYIKKLRNITVNQRNKKYVMDNNVLYTKNRRVLCQVFSDKRYKKDTFTLKRKTTVIGHGAFYRVSGYSHIIVNHDLDKIGAAAFAGSKIKSFYVKGNIRQILRGAFMYSDIRIWKCEKGVNAIPDYAFCSSRLKKIYIHSGLETIGKEAFYYCSGLVEVSFPDSLLRIESEAFTCCFSLKTINFKNLEYIGDGAFTDCFSLQEAVFPITTTFQGWAFGRCKSLEPKERMFLSLIADKKSIGSCLKQVMSFRGALFTYYGI